MTYNGKRAVALGIFDGVHLGHRRVMEITAGTAENGFAPSAFTFRSNTIRRKQGRSLEYIYTDKNKERIINALDIKDVFSEDFGSLKGLSGEEFVREILVKRLNTGIAVCGDDFRFGHNAMCGADDLVRFGKEYGFDAIIVPEERMNGEKVSSRRIRELLLDGNMKDASVLLGDRYSIFTEVVKGAQLGRTIGFPTINQLFAVGQLVPACGVYASTALIDGKRFPAMTNIGVKPTVCYGGAPLAETYIHGFSGSLYGKCFPVELWEFIRPERKFGSLDELKNQINTDVEHCLNIL